MKYKVEEIHPMFVSWTSLGSVLWQTFLLPSQAKPTLVPVQSDEYTALVPVEL